MILRRSLLLLCLLLSIGSREAAANEMQAARAVVAGPLTKLASSLQVIATVRAQNSMHQRLKEEEIDALDARWRNGDADLIQAVMDNDLSAYLGMVAQESDHLYTELFVIDEHGLNVGQSAVTSDYWQGDEAQFRDAIGGRIQLYPSYFDESTQKQQLKAALPVRDEEGRIIGVLVAGLDVKKLVER